MSERVRVLVVDDSALMRKLIPKIIESDPLIEVVGTAMDGAFALKKIAELNPDVVTLDLEMPRMDGMETLRLIMRHAPLPVIMFSTHSKEGAYATFKALALGAIDFVAKPKEASAGHLDAIAAELIDKIKVAKRAAGKVKSPAINEPSHPAKKECPRGAAAASHHRHRNFHRRAERLAICSFADSCRFHWHSAGRPAHARRFHRNVCPPPR